MATTFDWPAPGPAFPLAPPTPPAPASLARVRPGGVTFASITSIVLGSLCMLYAMMWSVLLTMLTTQVLHGGPFAAFLFSVAVVAFAFGALGLAAGIGGLRGAAWARWTMVVQFGMGCALVPLMALNIPAILQLTKAPAAQWFGRPAR